MKVAIVLFNIDLTNIDLTDYYLIGADKGALNLIKSGLTPNISIGDFDSINLDEFKIVEEKSKKVIKLNPVKDKTDTEEALDLALKISKDITIFGGIKGDRIDHFLSILSLFYKHNDLKIVDNNSLIIFKDNFKFKKVDYIDYKYISLFPLKDEVLTLKGFKYELSNFNVSRANCSLLTSNELKDLDLEIKSTEKNLIVFSKNDH